MKEIKPRLIFTDRKGRSWTGSARNLVIILFTFCVGVYVGIKVSDMDLGVGVQKEAHKDQTTVLGDRVAGQREGDRNSIEKEKVSIQQRSSPEVGQSVADTYPQQAQPEGANEGKINENNSQEYANAEQEPDIQKKEGFTVQVGAFKEIERANKALDELNMKGYKPYILPYVNSLGRNWYLVRIGKFNTREEAREFAISFERTEGMEAIVE
ncbi:MAG: SPOR domain-containing protein, partial [Deltaproteobacteria bacterium]|nr:SPOR domain-containing protein [Deltaproteobacteria bacterium]